MKTKDSDLEQRVEQLEFEVDLLKKRPVADGSTGKIDTSSLISI
jgi:hypothetical protein